jgi:hypothetical protein
VSDPIATVLVAGTPASIGLTMHANGAAEVDVDFEGADAGAPDTGPIDTGAPDAAPSARRVFVSSATSTGDLGGPAGADILCRDLASSAGLGGDWKAWISSAASSPSTRFVRSTVPYRLVDGTPVAASWDALVSGTLAHPIDRDEHGLLTLNAEVWTSTKLDGKVEIGGFAATPMGPDGCAGFTSAAHGAPYAAVGISNRTDFGWSDYYPQFCDRQARIYCVEQ